MCANIGQHLHSLNRVVSQYLTTKFLGHTTAEDLKESLLSALQNLDKSKLVQISMDEPNSNLFKI